MKTIGFLLIAAVLACAGCRPAETSVSNTNSPANSGADQRNVNVSANIPANTATNSASQTNSTVDTELLRQIEAQQAETADPRRAANRAVNSNSSQPAPKTKPGSSQRQTW